VAAPSTQSGISLSVGMRRLILIEVALPTALLVFGVYHGFIQTLYRAGILSAESFLGIDYYQGLTLHGVINAIVFTTLFAIAFGNALISRFLEREPNTPVACLSFSIMLAGTLLAAGAMFTGQASVLYTFYPPLQAHPAFYIGAALIVIGSWVSFFNWIPVYLAWRRQHPESKTPLAVVGIFSAFIVWLIATTPLAYEVVVMLIPWSLGWVDEINVLLARTLFWFFGHPLVYFWLIPAYVMYYVMLPRLAGGKLFSDYAGRLVFMLFIVLSAPVGLHHQLGDPGIGTSWKWLQTILTFGVALPSLITAFTLAASLEYAGRENGGRGLFGWWAKLPYLDRERWLFPYLFAGLVLFFFGGITGIVNTSYSVNNVVHNTAWVPAHFHTTVGGPVLLGFTGMSLYLISKLGGKSIRLPTLNIAVPYLWLLGVALFSTAMSITGIDGEPRRTNLGLTYTNPNSALFVEGWWKLGRITALGGTIMLASMVCYFAVFFSTLFSKRREEPSLDFPVAEAYHDEEPGALANFRPWVVAAVVLVVLAYLPPLYDVLRATFSGSEGYWPD
jgi:cytochrome c oxidase subunit 1